MRFQNHKKVIVKKAAESAGVFFAMLLVFTAVVFAFTTWAPGGPPQAPPGEGNVRPPVTYDDGGRINNVSAPVAETDAVNKGYVDALTTLAADGGGGDLFVAYGSTSCPAGFDKVYEGILTVMYVGGATHNTNYMGLSNAAPVTMAVICADAERQAYDPNNKKVTGAHNNSYTYHPLTEYSTCTNMMKCAVCVR